MLPRPPNSDLSFPLEQTLSGGLFKRACRIRYREMGLSPGKISGMMRFFFVDLFPAPLLWADFPPPSTFVAFFPHRGFFLLAKRPFRNGGYLPFFFFSPPSPPFDFSSQDLCKAQRRVSIDLFLGPSLFPSCTDGFRRRRPDLFSKLPSKIPF